MAVTFFPKNMVSPARESILLKTTRSTKSNTVQPPDEIVPTPTKLPIKKGEPLCIEIVTFYSGNAPRTWWNQKSLLLNSGIKRVGTVPGAPKIINALIKTPSKNSYIEMSAFDMGTHIVYYSPSFEDYFTLSFILQPEQLNTKEIDQLSNLFSAAQAVPIFAPATTALMIGNMITRGASTIINLLSSKKPFLEDTIKVDEKLTLGFALISSDTLYPNTKSELDGYEVVSQRNNTQNETRYFLAKNGKEYAGDCPYIILSIDNKERTELTDFEPLITSSDILEQFYTADKSGQFSTSITNVLSSINDIKYIKKIAKLKKDLAKTKDEDKKKELEEKIEGYKEKIQDKDLKL